MNVTIKDYDITPIDPVTFVPLSDVHIGHVDFDRQYFKDTIAWIKKKGALTVLLGDMLDGISRHDRRFENASIDPFFYPHMDHMHHKQVEVFLELIDPIKDRIVGVMGGNHENTIKKFFSYDATSVIADALSVPILTDPAYIVFRFHAGKSVCSLKIWASHGCFLGGRLRGGKVNNLERTAQYFPANDLYLAGHTHDKWVIEGHTIRLSKNYKLEERRCYYANTGAFLRTYQEKGTDTWASRSVFSPQVPGCVRFDFYLKRDKKSDVRYIDIHSRV